MAQRKSFEQVAREVCTELFESIVLAGYEAELKLTEHELKSIRVERNSLEKQRNRLARALLATDYIEHSLNSGLRCEFCRKGVDRNGMEQHHPGCAVTDAKRILGR